MITDDFNSTGLMIVPSVVPMNMVKLLRSELENAIRQDAVQYPNVFDKGMVHNCMFRGKEMASLLDNEMMNDVLSTILGETFIIYAYQSSSLGPEQGNYGSRLHVDCPRFIDGYCTNVGVIFPLDDFTLENGATFYLPGSHKTEVLPTEEQFYKNATRGVCKAGDMIVFHGRLAHAAGFNNTGKTRHSLTINFCRSYMRQRFDFARMIAKSCLKNNFSDNMKKLMGWNVRMPTSLEEFYLPEDERLYKANQG